MNQLGQAGTGMQGFECTISVDDIDKTIRAIEANGGKIVMAKSHIPTVGTLVYFNDTEGNHAGALQYEPGAMALSLDSPCVMRDSCEGCA